jgi:hypothetical protein
MAEHSEPWIPFGQRLVAREYAAQPCANSQSFKEIRGDGQSSDAVDLVTGTQIQHGRS